MRVPAATSLKEKRASVKTIVEGARRRFSVAASEVADQDLRQRARLGFAAVAPSASRAVEIIDTVERFVWSFPEVEVVSGERHWLEVER